ncbi:hypothetical protein [Desulfosarcina ovata]|uniref:Uncharacterized protein n=1 Tax=Desulfosarcina ovata subsp. ovata TaxID=2752305 RepID=A0A5K8AHL7_9BACT|nr:hypothetical protein [Desulfosarcina ovata]BBO92193.1 hypothetical protein DSCOOX_53730 [Desulfosarcina ovata subsp. ovata]
MKRILLIVFIIAGFQAVAFAEESQELSQAAMQSIQQQIREMSDLGIPETPAREMLTQMVQNRFRQQIQVQARQVVMDAARAGLPTEPVMNKAMEGMAKKAGEEQVVRAMETVRNRYAVANRMARSLPVESRIDAATRAVADSLAAGMQTADMEAVMAQLQVRTRQQTRNRAEKMELAIQTMQTVRTMARLGIPSTEVAETLGQALQNGYTYREMKQLRHRMAKQIRFASPRQIASQHAGSIGKGGTSGSSSGHGSGGGSGNGGSGGGSGGGGSGGGSGGGGSGGAR